MEEKRVFKDEKEKLEALRGWGGILPGKIIFAVPPIYKEVYPDDPSKWPVFKIKPSDGLDFAEDLDNYVEGEPASKKRMREFRRGILEWKNLKDDDGQEIQCLKGEDGKVTPEAIRSLRSKLQNWLLRVIAGADTVSPEESEGLKF